MGLHLSVLLNHAIFSTVFTTAIHISSSKSKRRESLTKTMTTSKKIKRKNICTTRVQLVESISVKNALHCVNSNFCYNWANCHVSWKSQRSDVVFFYFADYSHSRILSNVNGRKDRSRWFKAQSYKMKIFTQLKVFLATATRNFTCVKTMLWVCMVYGQYK